MKTTTFENAQIGDNVWSFRCGWGEVLEVPHGSVDQMNVRFSRDRCRSYTVDGIEYGDENRSLFWGEIKFDIPEQPVRFKLIHGVKVLDISFEPKEGGNYYYPDPASLNLFTLEFFCVRSLFSQHRLEHGFCYPHTAEGKQAAILHAKAMMGEW